MVKLLKVYALKVLSKYLKYIKDNKKVFEVRLFREHYSLIKKGDVLILYDEFGNVVRAEVKDVHIYNSFEELFKNIDYKKVIPFANSISEALNEYKKIYGNNLNRNKVIAFKIKVIDYLWNNTW